MILAVASGKGGTGKTTLSVALTMTATESVQLLDCDVEEPNGHIFMRLPPKSYQEVGVLVPMVDEEKCTACGKCADICEFNAIANLENKVIMFPELCHSCGGCKLVCPEGAIREVRKKIGGITKSEKDNMTFIQGRLEVGHALSPPLIRAVKHRIEEDKLNILDCPPGNACPVIASLNGADYVILVTEATPFGLNDLMLSVDTLRRIDLPFGVIINRSDTGDDGVKRYLEKEGIKLLLEIPESMEVAHAYSKGEPITDAIPELKEKLLSIIEYAKSHGKEGAQ